MSLTLCICTMNRPDELRTALTAVFAGNSVPDQVIASDDGEGTAAEVAGEFGQVLYQQGPRRGLSANRNACIDSATSTHVAFIDDDVVVSADFVSRAAAKTETDAVWTGWELNFMTAEPRKVTPHNPNFLGFQKVEPAGDRKSIVINATVFPAALFSTARFDEQIMYGYEEIDMAQHAAFLGYTIKFDPDMWVEHHPSASNRDGYAAVLNESRLYIAYKAKRLYEGSRPRAALFNVVAGAHHVAHAVYRGHGPKAAFRTLANARRKQKALRLTMTAGSRQP